MLPWPLFAFVPLGVIVSACQRIDPDGTRDGDRVNRVQPEMPDDGNGFCKHASLAELESRF